MKYQRFQVSNQAKIGTPGPLPSELVGLDAQALADLSWTDPALGYKGQGFVFVPETIGERAAAKLAGANLQYSVRFANGFPCIIKGEAETLQLRENDQLNWLIYKDSCDDAIAAGQGDQTAVLPLRTTANRLHALTANEGRALMLALRVFGAGLLMRHWLLKDAIAAAVEANDSAALEAIDPGAGWPTGGYEVE